MKLLSHKKVYTACSWVDKRMRRSLYKYNNNDSEHEQGVN